MVVKFLGTLSLARFYLLVYIYGKIGDISKARTLTEFLLLSYFFIDLDVSLNGKDPSYSAPPPK